MMKRILLRSIGICIAFAAAFVLAAPQAWSATDTVYLQTNLVSDIPGLAQTTDPNLKNPWGNGFSATGPFWPADAGSNKSTVYSGTGSTISATVVDVPGGPAGVISNSTNDFIISNGRKASFIFATLSGAIYSWNTGTAAEQSAAVPGTNFTGLALANNGSANYIYAANTAGNGSIEVFDAKFARVTLAGSFNDPNLPGTIIFGGANYVPYNIQNINGQLYVEYTNFKTGGGAVSVFDANGNFLKELIPAGTPQLRQPWGVVIAPAGFGTFANDLLVGNFGDGRINAFDPNTGAFLGTLTSFYGPITNSGLWSLSVRTGGTYNTNAVYILAGINNQADGLFAAITPVTPSTVGIANGPSLTPGTLGTAYSQKLTPTGGTPPYANWTVASGSLPPGISLDSTTGILTGTPTPVGGTFSFTIAMTDSTGAKGTGFFQLTIQPPTSSTPLNRIGSFGQLASGGGWKTTITLINLSANTVNAQINLYGDNGSPAVFPVSFPEFNSTSMASSSVSVSVGPNDSMVIQSAAAASMAVGWADVLASGPLSGYLAFEATSPLDSQGTVPLDGRLATSMLMPYDNTAGYQTGVALANQSSAAQAVTVTLFDQNGVQLSSSKMNLPAYGHSSFFLNSQFSKSANQLGIMQVQGSGGITGVGLRISPQGSCTSIPIIR
jgi:uncharacterized protein (TIGR03118 family)